MSWSSFLIYALGAALCWILGAFHAFRDKRNWALGMSAMGSVVFLSFVIGMWFELERPPMRTMERPDCGILSSCQSLDGWFMPVITTSGF